MALRILVFPPKILPQSMNSRTHPSPSLHTIKNPSNFQIHCSNTNSKIHDLELALELATEVDKLNNQLVQKQEAMKKSRELLFTQLCQYSDLGTDELKRKWEKMDEEDRWVLVNGFIAEWGVNFHPLSAKSVKEMVDDYFVDDKNESESAPAATSSSSSVLLSGLKKFLGFQSKE